MPDTDDASAEPLGFAVVNARVWTGDSRRPWADAVIVRGARIEAVGGSAELRKRAGVGIRVIDARGMLVLPGTEGGMLAPGHAASLVVVERDVSGSPNTARDAEIVLAIVDGRIAVDRDALAS